MSGALSRRMFLRSVALGAAATVVPRRGSAQARGRVVVIGGGFGGATCARELSHSGLAVTLIEPDPVYTACPFSNAVLVGMRPIEAQQFKLDILEKMGIGIVRQRASHVDPQRRHVVLQDGSLLDYDRLVLSPGIDIRFDALPGYDEEASAALPHAWKAGEQTTLFARQLQAMNDGGTVVIVAPANPFRCPPGPYERVSLIAHYLKAHKPRSKLLILDAKDTFSKQRLFQSAWQDLYPGIVEWVSLSSGGKVIAVEAKTKTLITDFGRHTGNVVNVIPPQRAGRIAQAAGVADRSGWCPIDPVTFESRLQPNIHVIGDASIAGGMPKSAFSANAQGKVCAAAVASLLRGEAPAAPKLINTCYSLVAPDYGISVAGVYRPFNGVLTDVEGAGGTSPANAPRSFRAQEAAYAEAWFQTITAEVFG
jgi:sulfide dehydrogenase [flavocytochrome c] flavoprotein subunit